MTVPPKVRALLESYGDRLETEPFLNRGIPTARVADGVRSKATALGHVRWMIHRVLSEADSEGWSERKLNRWLGFIQGTMWATGFVGLLKLRDDTRHLYLDEDTTPIPVAPPMTLRTLRMLSAASGHKLAVCPEGARCDRCGITVEEGDAEDTWTTLDGTRTPQPPSCVRAPAA